MNILRLIILSAFALQIAGAQASEAKSSCVVKAQDPIIQSFFRSKGYEVDDEKGNFEVEFEVTCEAVDKQKDKFSSTEVHMTTTKLELFNVYEGKKVVYHAEEDIQKSGRVESAFVLPCGTSKEAKQKLLENSLKMLQDIDCSDDEE